MAKIISIHEYVLKPDADPLLFEKAVREASEKGLLSLPGLSKHFLVKGIRGSRQGCYAAVWIYESREKWEKLWGPLAASWEKSRYPEMWKVWEDEVLAPFLDREPDKISFTAYMELV
jgi:hypothetical protein